MAAGLALATASCTAAGRAGAWPAGTSTAPSSVRATTAPTDGSTPKEISILGSGDVLLHPGLWAQARRDARAAGRSGYDFRPLFAGVRQVVSSADLAVCHLETPVARPGGPFIGYPRFSVPPQVISALADTGYDTCSTASNHSLDQGESGVRRTLDALDAAGITHAGSYRTKSDHDAVTIVEVRGVKVAHVSYTLSFNGLRRPAGKPWIANLINERAILAEARRARRAGAAIVVVSLHWGTEYRHSPNASQLALANQLLASSDIDLILGCHAHVVQPFAQIGGKWVSFGMGNEVAHHADPVNDNREGVLPRFTLTEVSTGHWRVSKAEAIPVWMDLTPQNRLINLADALARPNLPVAQRRVYQAAYDRISHYVNAMGAKKHGLAIAGSE